MTDLTKVIPAAALAQIAPTEQHWLLETFQQCGDRYPTLEEIWVLMDQVWDAKQCDPECMDARIGAFYSHPVWLLNGLFIDQHEPSLENRRRFTEWVVRQRPLRVADYGGGFGGLARMIGAACPDAIVEVIEPHPHPAGIALAEETANVRYQPVLTGEYDILIATDVFEHVPDPLALAKTTAGHLQLGGQYLTANCFWPVIRCHLPQTFHFRHSWNAALVAMGLQLGDSVCYGQVFSRRVKALNLPAARVVERRSQRLFPWLKRMPGWVRGPLTRLAWRV